jgi:hypothetical protein
MNPVSILSVGIPTHEPEIDRQMSKEYEFPSETHCLPHISDLPPLRARAASSRRRGIAKLLVG